MYGIFYLENLFEKECKRFFGFKKDDIPRLAQRLSLPNKFSTDSTHRSTTQEGLCILLRRPAYSNRLIDLERLFSRSVPPLSKRIDYVMIIKLKKHAIA